MKTPQAIAGMNETASILFLLIVGVWFFTNGRFQALVAVIKAPIKSQLYTGPVTTLPKDSPVPGLVVPVGETVYSPNTGPALGMGVNPNPALHP